MTYISVLGLYCSLLATPWRWHLGAEACRSFI